MSNTQRAVAIVSCVVWAITEVSCLSCISILEETTEMEVSWGWMAFGWSAIVVCLIIGYVRKVVDAWLIVLSFWLWPAGFLYALVAKRREDISA